MIKRIAGVLAGLTLFSTAAAAPAAAQHDYEPPTTEFLSEETSPGGEPPTLASLIEERYGVFSLQAEDPVLPLDEPFTVEAAEEQPADVEFWLLPPDGGEAISLDSSTIAEDTTADRSVWPITDSVPAPEQEDGADAGAGSSPDPAEGSEDAAAQDAQDEEAQEYAAEETGPLAMTGTTIAVLAGVAVMLLGLGAWLVIRGRNRPDSS